MLMEMRRKKSVNTVGSNGVPFAIAAQQLSSSLVDDNFGFAK
jgi:hypothetical protein